MRVLSRDAAGALVFKAGRFVSVSGVEAKVQLLRERMSLRRGEDAIRPLRGVEWDALIAVRASPAAAAIAVSDELRLEPLLAAGTCELATPDGFVSRVPVPGEARRAYALRVRAVFRPDSAIVNLPLEVPLT